MNLIKRRTKIKRRKFLSLTGVTVITPFSLANSKPAKKCKDCKFYLPDLEVDGYDLLTCKHELCTGNCIYRWCKIGACGQQNHRGKILYPTWPPKNPLGHKNKTNESNFADAKKGDYCFLIGGTCKRISCVNFLSKKASEKDAEKIVEKVRKMYKEPLLKENRKTPLDGESVFKIDLRCSPEYRLTWLGKLLSRLRIK